MKRSLLRDVTGFEWDEANTRHIANHNVTPEEAEQVFSDKNNVIIEDLKHSIIERRPLIVGKTQKGRLLYQVFTRRRNNMRVISSRDINRKEVNLYEKKARHS
ncbi:BrnT family toxin [Candidatus Gottesmanbacteria bacterium]|nr:BrnT family toxin [Candidatus Gottesmanbacteria bacterium]